MFGIITSPCEEAILNAISCHGQKTINNALQMAFDEFDYKYVHRILQGFLLIIEMLYHSPALMYPLKDKK